jgi:hypothetical protein
MSKSNHFLLFMICSSLQPFAFYMHKSRDKEIVRRIFPPFSRNWEEEKRIQAEKKAKCSIHKQEFKSNFLIMRKSINPSNNLLFILVGVHLYVSSHTNIFSECYKGSLCYHIKISAFAYFLHFRDVYKFATKWKVCPSRMESAIVAYATMCNRNLAKQWKLLVKPPMYMLK